MRLQEIGHRIREARSSRQLTQAQLARAGGVSRTTLNQIESGLVTEIGAQKLRALLAAVGLELVARPAGDMEADFIRMACTSANVSFREPLTENELIRILLTGRVPAGRRAHLRKLLDEASPALLNGLAGSIARWTRPGRLEKGLAALESTLKPRRKVAEWLKII